MSRESPSLPGLTQTTFRIAAVLLFLGLSAQAIATLLVSRGPLPSEITSSPASPERELPVASEVLDTGNFLTRAADGEAYVALRFERPASFRKLVHAYRYDVAEPQRMAAVALLASDDGAHWTKVGEADAKGPYAAFELDLRNAGLHTWWKLTVVKSGEAPDVVFGQLQFIGDESFLQSRKIDVVWLALIPALLLLLIAFRIPLSRDRLFAVTALPVALFAMAYSLGYVGFHAVLAFDSFGYLQPVLVGSYSEMRSVGYPFILSAVSWTTGLDQLAWIQLGAGVACYLAGAYLLAIRFGNRWIGPVFVLAFLLQGTTTQFAADVLTEGLFTAGLGLFAAALGALAWQPSRLAVAAAVAGIVLATLTKAVGIVLVVPALLLVRFLPRGKRLSVAGAIVIAGLGTYALLALSSFVRTGAPTPESFAGYSLIGHVGWMLDDTAMPPSDLSRRMIGAAAPVVAQRPADLADIHSLATLDRYVDVTIQDFNRFAWQTLIPIAGAELRSQQATNAFLLRFGISSIRAHPGRYLRHVAAHFYGIWRDLEKTMPLRVATFFARAEPVINASPPLDVLISTIPAHVLTPYPNRAVLKGEMMAQLNLPVKYKDLWDFNLFRNYSPVALGALALILSLLFLLPGRLTHIYRTEIMIALSLNAYFGSHVLLQVTLQRYAAAGILAAFFLAVAFAFTTFYTLRQLLAAGIGCLSENARRDALARLADRVEPPRAATSAGP